MVCAEIPWTYTKWPMPFPTVRTDRAHQKGLHRQLPVFPTHLSRLPAYAIGRVPHQRSCPPARGRATQRELGLAHHTWHRDTARDPPLKKPHANGHPIPKIWDKRASNHAERASSSVCLRGPRTSLGVCYTLREAEAIVVRDRRNQKETGRSDRRQHRSPGGKRCRARKEASGEGRSATVRWPPRRVRPGRIKGWSFTGR